MLLQQKPTRWTCTAASFAMATYTAVDTFLELLGHDGSEIINQLPDPLGRRGHHVQECVLVAMARGYSATPFELFPQAASVAPGRPARVVHYRGRDDEYNWSLFRAIVGNSTGVITGVGRNCHHAVAFHNGRILDPDGRAYPYSRSACETRGFYTQAAWIVAPFSRPSALNFSAAEIHAVEEWLRAKGGQGNASQAGLGSAEDGAAE